MINPASHAAFALQTLGYVMVFAAIAVCLIWGALALVDLKARADRERLRQHGRRRAARLRAKIIRELE